MYYLEKKEKVAARVQDANGFFTTVKKERWRGVTRSKDRGQLEAAMRVMAERARKRHRITEVKEPDTIGKFRAADPGLITGTGGRNE